MPLKVYRKQQCLSYQQIQEFPTRKCSYISHALRTSTSRRSGPGLRCTFPLAGKTNLDTHRFNLKWQCAGTEARGACRGSDAQKRITFPLDVDGRLMEDTELEVKCEGPIEIKRIKRRCPRHRSSWSRAGEGSTEWSGRVKPFVTDSSNQKCKMKQEALGGREGPHTYVHINTALSASKIYNLEQHKPPSWDR